MPRTLRAILGGALIFASALAWVATRPLAAFTQDASNLPILFEENFEQGAENWQPTDAAAWKIVEGNGGHVYSQHKRRSDHNPPHRSPLNISLNTSGLVADFVLDADVRSTVEDYNHRDICLFFGYQDPAHFYYVHLGKQTDDHANQIFIVDNAPRTKISTKTTPGTNWDDEWHHVRVARDTASGKIEIFYDDMDKPVMTATNKRFAFGMVGIGSFDDTGDWDNVVLRGNKAEIETK